MRHGLAQRGVIAHTGALLCVAALVFAATHARAAELEPRAYANAPVGMNFLIAGYAYSEGGLSTAPVADPGCPSQYQHRSPRLRAQPGCVGQVREVRRHHALFRFVGNRVGFRSTGGA